MIERKGLKLKPRESNHERNFKKYAGLRGCETRKFKQKRNDPDQIILCPYGRVLFIEFKRDENEPVREGQLKRLHELTGLGFACAVCYSYAHACRVLNDFLNEAYTV